MQPLSMEQREEVVAWLPDHIQGGVTSQSSSLTSMQAEVFKQQQGQASEADRSAQTMETGSASSLKQNDGPTEGPPARRGSLKPKGKSILRDGKPRDLLKKQAKDVSISNLQSKGTQTVPEGTDPDAIQDSVETIGIAFPGMKDDHLDEDDAGVGAFHATSWEKLPEMCLVVLANDTVLSDSPTHCR